MSASRPVARLTAMGAIAAAAVLSGCASGYATSYRSAEDANAQAAAEQRSHALVEPMVERVAEPAQPQGLIEAYEARGYTLIGSSAFDSDRRESEADAVAQGRKVGADLVLILNPKATVTATRTVQLAAPASFRHAPATTFGDNPAGQVPSQITSPRADQGYVPAAAQQTIQQTRFGAAYFVKRR